MHAGGLLLQSGGVAVRGLPHPAGGGALRPSPRRRVLRERGPGGLRSAARRGGGAAVGRRRLLLRPPGSGGLRAAGRGTPRRRGESPRRRRRLLLRPPRRHGSHRRPRPGGIPAAGGAAPRWTGPPPRHLPRPARHPHAAHARALRRPHPAAHLPPRRLRRHRSPRRPPAGAHPRRGRAPRRGAGRGAGAGPRRRADHGDRPLRRVDPPGPGAGALGEGRGRRHDDRQPLHRRARAVLAERGGYRRRPRGSGTGSPGTGARLLAPPRPHAGAPRQG